ncbi:pectin lyase-like protein [Whalleya microplaca]|nr:pectin lyase-like protein [Whalleya microplaca]
MMRVAFIPLLAASAVLAGVTIPVGPVGTRPPLPLGSPHPPPNYMKNNINNREGTAPDKGVLTGPVLGPLNASILQAIHGGHHEDSSQAQKRQNTNCDSWICQLASKGGMPLAPSGYQFYRNVQDFGAKGDGVTDDTAAINRAASSYSASELNQLRCGADCGSTTTLGALVYFPAGTYIISTPIIQYYYTQFVGNPNDKPVIKSTFNFTGIAMFDSDFYIPGGNGNEWYINQSNFYRQIRNFKFDMTQQNRTNYDNDQEYVPTGIHWQVGQATSITNCDFVMAVSTGPSLGDRATGVGIMMENGSGGFASDLTFTGGNVGFLAGSQQFTARNLQFTSCLTAIKSLWNWGIVWKNIYVLSCYIAIDATEYSTTTSQGTGSISVIDSHFNGVPTAITLAALGSQQPNIVLDNVLVEASAAIVLVSGGATLLEGSTEDSLYLSSWASGYQYGPDGGGGKTSGYIVPAPNKPESLLNPSGQYLVQSKPQYESSSADSFVVATDNGVSNDGTGNQTAAINDLLSGHVGSTIFFPAGVYLVGGTVKVPVGSIIVGSGWSQIMGTGSYFGDADNPQIMVQVGQKGDSGIIQISDMLFTVKGATAGCILMEWNVHESTQGSAAMWDSHFRVGGAAGSDLQLADCPVGSFNENCMAASLLMHITSEASGYFENCWWWVSDHDLDNPLNADASESPEGIPLNVKTQISVYAGRGVLIESKGPVWMIGTASEHAQLYQYQLLGASNIYMGHIQTESPYYQPNPPSTEPYKAGLGDPTFADCFNDQCRHAWALRIINSTDVFIYTLGFYAFFEDNQLGCTSTESCQLGLIDTSFSQGLWLYNIFTKGNVQIISPEGEGMIPVYFNDTTSDGYTSEIAAWLVLSLGGGDLGGTGSNGSSGGIVYIDPSIWPPLGSPGGGSVGGNGGGSNSASNITVACNPPCTYVFPPIILGIETIIIFPASTTSLEVGCFISDSYTGGDGKITATSEYVSVTVTTVLSIPAVTTTVLSVSNIPIVSGITSSLLIIETSVRAPDFTITDDAAALSSAGYQCISSPPNTRNITPKPWPWHTYPVPNTTISSTKTTPFVTITHTTGGQGPTCSGGCGSSCTAHCSFPCSEGCNTDGADCTVATCTRGGDCAGPTCTRAGDCSGDHCTRGGDCTGPRCEEGGDCSGPSCHRGGSCYGLHCNHGGGCSGPLCDHGGGCGPLGLGCPPGGCSGPHCHTPGDDDDDNDGQDDDFTDSNDPNSNKPNNEECTTSTFSSCRTLTIIGATTTTTCSNVVGCDTTGTDIASTITPAPAVTAGILEVWATADTDDFNFDVSAGSSIIDWLINIGDFSGITTSSPLPPLNSTSCPRPWSTTTVCNGSGGQSVCVGSSVCPPPSPIPTATSSDVTCSTAGQICLGTTTYTVCQDPLRTFPAPAVATAASTTTTSLRPRGDVAPPSTVSGAYQGLITGAPIPPSGFELSNSNSRNGDHGEDGDSLSSINDKRRYELLVAPRQDGCSSFSACALCATPTNYPCLDLSITGTGDFFYNIWEGHVIEDGVMVCQADFDCDDCQGLSDWVDCGGGSRWKFTDNELWYYSGKYQANYSYILPNTGTDVYGCGLVVPVFSCTRQFFSETEGPCQTA